MNAKFNMVLTDDLFEQLEQLASQEGKTKSAFIRDLIVTRIELAVQQEVQSLKERVEILEREVKQLKEKP